MLLYRSAVWFYVCHALLVWIWHNRSVWQAELRVVKKSCLSKRILKNYMFIPVPNSKKGMIVMIRLYSRSVSTPSSRYRKDEVCFRYIKVTVAYRVSVEGKQKLMQRTPSKATTWYNFVNFCFFFGNSLCSEKKNTITAKKKNLFKRQFL